MADSHPSVSQATPTLAPPGSEGSPWAAPDAPSPNAPVEPPAPRLAPPATSPVDAPAPPSIPLVAPSPVAQPVAAPPPPAGPRAPAPVVPGSAVPAPPATPAYVSGLPVAGAPSLPGDLPAGMSPAGPIEPGTPLAPLVPVDQTEERRTGRGAWIVLVALIVVIAFGVGTLVMLGGSSNDRVSDENGDAADEIAVVERDAGTFSLQAAAQGAVAASTVHYEMTVSMGSFGATTMSGAIDNEAQIMTMSMDMAGFLGGAETESIDTIIDIGNGKMYMSNSGEFGFPGGKPWLGFDLLGFAEMSGMSLEELQSEFSANPFDVAYLFDGADEVVEVGDDTIDGEPVKHYQVTVDLLAALEANPSLVQDQLDAEMLWDDVGGELVYDVWVTEGNELRRMSFSMDTLGEQMVVDMKVTEVGSPVDVVIPAPDEVEDMTELLGL